MKLYKQQILLAILITAIILAFNSCCTKMYCLGWDEANEIALQNFTSDELDSIALETFQVGSGFTNRIDSIFKSGTNGDYPHISLTRNFSKSHEYKITILSTGQVYTLTNFETKKESCNKCFPYHPEDDYYDELVSYSVNGETQYGLIKISK